MPYSAKKFSPPWESDLPFNVMTCSWLITLTARAAVKATLGRQKLSNTTPIMPLSMCYIGVYIYIPHGPSRRAVPADAQPTARFYLITLTLVLQLL